MQGGIMEFIIVSITLVATVIGAISGIGGGVIIKPVMDALLDLPMDTISFLSGTTVLAMTTVSLLSKGGDAKVDKPRGSYLAVGGAVGGILGKMLFSLVKEAAGNNAAVGLAQNVVMVILTLSVFIYVLLKAKVRTLNVQNAVLCVCIGLFLGLMSSFLGIGGGPINIMFLSLFFSLDSKNSALNSLYVIFCSQLANLISNLATQSIPLVSWPLLIAMMVSGIIGARIGRFFSRKMDNCAVDRLFLVLMAVIICISLANAIRFFGQL